MEEIIHLKPLEDYVRRIESMDKDYQNEAVS